MERSVGMLVLGLAIGIAASASYFYTSTPARISRPVTARKPFASHRRAVVGQGVLQPRTGPVLVGSPLAGTQIEAVPVKQGDRVKAGAILVELDASAAKLELELAQGQKKEALQRQQSETEVAQQRLKAAELAVRQAEESRDVQLHAQQKQVDVAELKVNQAESELQQLTALAGGADPIVSTQKVKQQQLLKQLSLAEREAAQVAYKRLEQSLEFQSQKVQAEQTAAETALRHARQGVLLEPLDSRIALADLKVRQAKVTAPFAATVLNVMGHPGELVTPQPLMEIANLDDLICIAEVDVSDVQLLAIGRTADITSPAFYTNKVTGTIEQIGAGAGSPTMRQVDPRQPVDRTVTKVRLRIDAQDALDALGSGEKAAVVLVGLRVEVEFALASSAEE